MRSSRTRTQVRPQLQRNFSFTEEPSIRQDLSKRVRLHATWMEIEKKRGISVTSSVMQFEYDGCHINILDTPGHQDFSEDTYRTLCAADSAVMVLDGAKGVETQTIKLFQVCRRRGIPIFTFINKMDRAAKNPFDLMDEPSDPSPSTGLSAQTAISKAFTRELPATFFSSTARTTTTVHRWLHRAYQASTIRSLMRCS